MGNCRALHLFVQHFKSSITTISNTYPVCVFKKYSIWVFTGLWNAHHKDPIIHYYYFINIWSLKYTESVGKFTSEIIPEGLSGSHLQLGPSQLSGRVSMKSVSLLNLRVKATS